MIVTHLIWQVTNIYSFLIFVTYQITHITTVSSIITWVRKGINLVIRETYYYVPQLVSFAESDYSVSYCRCLL